jgi:hypothetical protein
MSSRTRLSGALLAAAAALLGATALAVPREYQVFKTDHPPAIDGDVRDDIWRAVPWSGDFVGLRGAKPDAETQFAMAWDEQFLYVAIRCKEPRPQAIHAESIGRDPRIVNDDHVEILLASSDLPGGAGQPAGFFQIFLNAGRGRMDQWIEEGGPARRLEGGPANASEPETRLLGPAGLDSAARVHSSEWVVEAAIPLPKVGCPLREGLTYAGNICRVRPGAAVKEMAWSFVPGSDRGPARGNLRRRAGFGLFKLGGPAPKAPPIQNGDAVSLLNGDLLNGNLLGLADGEIQFSSPAFAEPVRLSAAEVRRLDLAWTETDEAPSQFYLSNGDRITGKMLSMSAETVSVESPSLGRISFPRALLSNISSGGFWLDSRFETGRLEPWELVSGNCALRNGALRLSGGTPGGPHQAILALPLHQDKTVTLIADCDPTPPFTPLLIQLFADRVPAAGEQIQSGVALEVNPVARLVVYNDGQATSRPGLRGRIAPTPAAERVRVKVMYDPTDGRAAAWYNGTQIAEISAPEGPKEGEYLLVGAARPLSIRRMAVYCGLPAPEGPTAGPKPGELLSYLSNGDLLRASQVDFADGDFIFTTEFGPMKVRADRVLSIAFPATAGKPAQADKAAAARKPPAVQAPSKAGSATIPVSSRLGAGLVETSAGRFTLELAAITDEFVIGRSPDLGEIKLLRRAVRCISFPAW